MQWLFLVTTLFNWCVEKFNKDYASHCAAMRQYQKELCEYKKSPLKATEAPVKPKLPTWQDYKKEFNAIRKEKYPFTYEVTKYASQQSFINFGQAVSKYFGNVPATSANPPVFTKGTASDATNKIFFFSIKTHPSYKIISSIQNPLHYIGFWTVT